jgi:hypothetical protein
LLLLALASVAVGAYVLPKFARKRHAPAANDRGLTERAPGRAKHPSPDANRKVERPLLVSPFDTPRVKPELPPGGGALDLARTIDREVDGALLSAGVPASPLAGDAEFVRRVHLDLTGRIPSRQRTVAFLDSDDPHKRARLIDELLARPAYGRHFARIWADLLVKRDFDNNKNLRTFPFIQWLAEQFNKGRTWDRIVSDMITATGREDQAPQTFFLMANLDNRQPSPAKLVGATSNLFLGIQLHCAECHKHPFTARWGMDDFWGLAAFFSHTQANRPQPAKGKKRNVLATFVEVDERQAPRRKGKKAKARKPKIPVILAGPVIRIPDPTNPRKTLRVVEARYFESKKPPPKGPLPYRPHLAAWLTSEQNRYFAPAAVNRLWAHFFARGFVNPLDDMNDQNKPTHPVLLPTLAGEFARARYDLKYLIRAICNSQTYQRTSRPLPENKADDKLFSHAPVKVMGARQLLASLAVATGAQRPATPLRVRRQGKGKAGRRSPNGIGGDPLVRFFDTREYDDDPTEFSFGIPQLLRLMNTRLTGSSEAVAARLMRAHKGDGAKVLEEMYLTALARRPSAAEVRRLSDFVARRGDPRKGYAGVYWALLNSAEFVSIH